MKKIRFATDGFRTALELGGKTIGGGVQKLDFHHSGGEPATLCLEIDLDRFHFLPDGAYDTQEKEIMCAAETDVCTNPDEVPK